MSVPAVTSRALELDIALSGHWLAAGTNKVKSGDKMAAAQLNLAV